jgi:hypothetical protein
MPVPRQGFTCNRVRDIVEPTTERFGNGRLRAVLRYLTANRVHLTEEGGPMNNPMENAPWWNTLFEITALPAVNAALPFVFAVILAFALVGVGRALKRGQRQPRSPRINRTRSAHEIALRTE